MLSRKITKIVTSLLYITNGALWIHWLRTLGNEPDQTKKCSEVQPTLRLVLHILAWFGLVSAVLFGGWLMYYIFKVIPVNLMWIAGPSMLIVVLGVALFVTQITYIRSVASSEQRVAENCTDIETVKHAALIVVSALIIALGVFSLFNTLLVGDDAMVRGQLLRKQLQKKLTEIVKNEGKGTKGKGKSK